MLRSKIISILKTPIFVSTPAPAEVEEENEFEGFEALEEFPGFEALEGAPIRSRFPFPSPAVKQESESEPALAPEPAAEPWYPPVIQAPIAVSPAEAALQKVKAAQEAALAKKGELMQQQLLQEQTKTLIKEMDEAGLLPAQLMDLEVEVMEGQAVLDSLLDQLGF